MYTVEFYQEKSDFWGLAYLEKKVVKTGKCDMGEAFDVAVENGCDPMANVKIYWED